MSPDLSRSLTVFFCKTVISYVGSRKPIAKPMFTFGVCDSIGPDTDR